MTTYLHHLDAQSFCFGWEPFQAEKKAQLLNCMLCWICSLLDSFLLFTVTYSCMCNADCRLLECIMALVDCI